MSNPTTETDTQSSLSSVTRGASLHFLGRILSTALKFVLNLVLTRGLGSSLFGIYAYATTIFSLILVVAGVGTGKSLLRFLPMYEDDPRRRNWVVGLAYVTALMVSVVLGACLYLAAPVISAVSLDSPLLVDALRVFALVLPFNTAMRLTSEVFRGLERLELKIIVANIVHPAFQLLVVVIALVLGYSLVGVVAAISVGLILVCLFAVMLLYRNTTVRPFVNFRGSSRQTKDFYSYSIPLTLKDLGALLYNRIDILMVGFFLTDTAVGIYQVSVLLSTMLALPLGAFNQLFPPVASRLYSNENMAELERVYEIVTRWALTVSIPPALVMGLYSTELLEIFGSEFAAGTLVLILFTVAQLTDSAVGPSGYLLLMTDHQYLNMGNQWLLGVLNVVFNYFFIQELGLIGAAVASASILAIINLVRLVEVWYTEGLVPYSTSFWKPFVAGAITGLVMAVHSFFLEGYFLLISGSLSGSFIFICLLYLFGIEEHDQSFFEELIGRKLPEW